MFVFSGKTCFSLFLVVLPEYFFASDFCQFFCCTCLTCLFCHLFLSDFCLTFCRWTLFLSLLFNFCSLVLSFCVFDFGRGSTFLFLRSIFAVLSCVSKKTSILAIVGFSFIFLPSWLLFFTAAIEGPSLSYNPASPTKEDHDDKKKEARKEKSQESLIGANWPSLPIPAGSQDSLDKKSPKATPWKVQQRGPEDYERDRVGKYAQYFKGNEILPIPEIVQQMEPRILSLVISDLKTKRLVGLKIETFEGLLRKAGIPCQYFCRGSFATWDVLLPTEEQAVKAAASNIMTKHFRLQPEYKGTRRVRVTVCNVPAYITGAVLASYLSAFGKVEEINLLRSPIRTAYGDYAFRLCLTFRLCRDLSQRGPANGGANK